MTRGPVIDRPVSPCCQAPVFVQVDTEGVVVADCERCARSYTLSEPHAAWARAGVRSTETLHRPDALMLAKLRKTMREALGLSPC
jgi:hypothetical protein